MSEREERDPTEAIQEIREKLARGEEPTAEERDFLEREGVRLDPDEGGDRPVA
jgi:hypothetical protein